VVVTREIERRLIIFGVRLRQPFYFGSTRTPGHLILGVLAKFSGVYYYRTPFNGSPARTVTKRTAHRMASLNSGSDGEMK